MPLNPSSGTCRHFTPGWERNMDDDMIRLLAKKGGVIQITFGSMFVNEQVHRRYSERKKKAMEHIKAKNLQGDEKEAFIEEYTKANPIGDADISDVVDHIDHVVKLVGIDHVGIGSDFDGVGDSLPTGLKGVSCYRNLIRELLKRGYLEEDIEKICSGNFLRVWSKVQQIGQDLRAR